jgi:hypothetical protein
VGQRRDCAKETLVTVVQRPNARTFSREKALFPAAGKEFQKHECDLLQVFSKNKKCAYKELLNKV